MQNLSDNDLDKHFQEAAEKYRPPFEPAAWNAMQERLDQPGEVHARPITFKRSLPFLLIFLAGSITGVLTWSYFTAKNDPEQNALTSVRPGESINNPSVAVAPDTTKDNNTFKHDVIPPERTGSSSSSVVHNIPRANETRKGKGTSKEPSAAKAVPKETYSTQRSESISSNENPEENPAIDVIAFPADNKTEMQIKDEQRGLTTHGHNDPRGKTPASVDSLRQYDGLQNASEVNESSDSTGNPHETIDSQAESIADKNAQRSVPLYRMSLIAGLSPDFSSVDFGQHTKPGFNFAGLVELHFTSKLSLMTGIISSKKLYKARDLEYYGQAYPEAEGDCRIIDIPVNVYYRFAGTSRYSWFAGAGVSSYIMKKETYVFYYDSPYGKASYDKEIRNENNEWFKVLNLSAGVARKINSRCFIEVEPFVKVPLSGIGDGHLNVNTAGMFVRVRYSLLKTY